MAELLKWVGGSIVVIYCLLKGAKEVILLTPSKKDDKFWNSSLVKGGNVMIQLGADLFKIEKIKGLIVLKPIDIPEDDVE